ncbi:aminoglycoside phosphotransferase family protein [Couchioplanes azureus]|uniref:aminoglycoside phosphotransferase family protein n=1 Tax=Couchioplanes caeruleus TaxID=56438 RepID=UPI00166FCA6B|nr:aminoglycoside phosphotransferase family protein [Couchioplanes caeruleus]
MHPPAFVRNVTGNWGDAGRTWLADLPGVIAAVARQWDLTVGPPYPLSYHWVAPVRRADGSAAVLKLGLPGAAHLAAEATALDFFAGRGAARLLARDDARGALLIERLEPGTTLRGLVRHHDDRATAVLADLMRRLHRPAPPGLALKDLAARTADFAAHLDRFPGDAPLPRDLVIQAMHRYGDLCASAGSRVVLHGDLHHENVLAAGREPWLAIDPHGVVGDPAAEIGPVLYNPLDGDEPTLSLLMPRVEQFADALGIATGRVVAWGFAQAVLSEVWDAEGGGTSPGRALQVALALRPLLD